MSRGCWAAPLGDCSDKISREHLVTSALFEDLRVRVAGFPWCQGGEHVIGLSSLVGKLLCSRHNNLLAPVDAHAAEVFGFFREIRRIAVVRERLRSHIWRTVKYQANGRVLERWFLKSAINLALSGRSDLRWVVDDAPLFSPPSPLVKAAFGQADLPAFMGLYAVAMEGGQLYSSDAVEFAPLIKDDEFIVGALFGFRGFRFVLSLTRQRLPDYLDFLTFPGWRGARAIYHLPRLNFENRGRLSQRLQFVW